MLELVASFTDSYQDVLGHKNVQHISGIRWNSNLLGADCLFINCADSLSRIHIS